MMWDGDLSSYPEENYRKYNDALQLLHNPVGDLVCSASLGFSDNQTPSSGESPVSRLPSRSFLRTCFSLVGLGSCGIFIGEKITDALWGKVFDSLLDGAVSAITHLF